MSTTQSTTLSKHPSILVGAEPFRAIHYSSKVLKTAGVAQPITTTLHYFRYYTTTIACQPDCGTPSMCADAESILADARTIHGSCQYQCHNIQVATAIMEIEPPGMVSPLLPCYRIQHCTELTMMRALFLDLVPPSVLSMSTP